MRNVRWLFFDLGNTLISEEDAWESRLRLLVEALRCHGRRCSLEEARAALAAAAEFAPRFIIRAIEKLVDDKECRRSALAAARYRKELEIPYAAAEPMLRALSVIQARGDREPIRQLVGAADAVGFNAVRLDLPVLLRIGLGKA
jgi:FMN phosphatase YigB (HAD superfamily)